MRRVAILLAALAIALALFGPAAHGAGEERLARRLRSGRFLAGGSSDAKACRSNSACGTGRRCCSGKCTDVSSDKNNCGKCDKVCNYTRSCCSGKCVELEFDKKNCGRCFRQCKTSCLYGLCDYGA